MNTMQIIVQTYTPLPFVSSVKPVQPVINDR